MIDRQAMSTRGCGRCQMQGAIAERQILIGRNDENAIGLQHRSFNGFQHRQACELANQLSQDTLMIGREMLNDNERQSRAVG